MSKNTTNYETKTSFLQMKSALSSRLRAHQTLKSNAVGARKFVERTNALKKNTTTLNAYANLALLGNMMILTHLASQLISVNNLVVI